MRVTQPTLTNTPGISPLRPYTPSSKLLGWYHLLSIFLPLLINISFISILISLLHKDWISGGLAGMWGGTLDSDVMQRS
jgi:hypothetical protein